MGTEIVQHRMDIVLRLEIRAVQNWQRHRSPEVWMAQPHKIDTRQ